MSAALRVPYSRVESYSKDEWAIIDEEEEEELARMQKLKAGVRFLVAGLFFVLVPSVCGLVMRAPMLITSSALSPAPLHAAATSVNSKADDRHGHVSRASGLDRRDPQLAARTSGILLS
ncbi:hypothetical protein CSOJ01_03488 [Colletotrichum sojae]|uniref:Uncharacterized protein n=1 Tax=Colletotrichum sojae TaxID=2175907 RepID=A0A8H6JMU6_9PEZI|nr:hypothetical protein CSOJ01_03488 [Colletotrichum sojae]